jgi:hypothetical protein
MRPSSKAAPAAPAQMRSHRYLVGNAPLAVLRGCLIRKVTARRRVRRQVQYRKLTLQGCPDRRRRRGGRLPRAASLRQMAPLKHFQKDEAAGRRQRRPSQSLGAVPAERLAWRSEPRQLPLAPPDPGAAWSRCPARRWRPRSGAVGDGGHAGGADGPGSGSVGYQGCRRGRARGSAPPARPWPSEAIRRRTGLPQRWRGKGAITGAEVTPPVAAFPRNPPKARPETPKSIT